MGDVIQLRGPVGKPAADPQTDLEERKERKEQTAIYLAEQIRLLREALPDDQGLRNPRMSPADQEIVARALGSLLHRLEKERRIGKAKVLRMAGIGSDTDSTKHLSYYATLPGKESKRLRAIMRPYMKIAKAAAALANLDEDDVLSEVFGTAGFWKSGQRQAAKAFAKLAERLHWVMDAVARKHTLTALFRSIERANVAPAPSSACWDSEQAEGRPLAPEEITITFEHDRPQQWPIEFYQPSWEAETEAGDFLPAYPSLVLGAWVLGNRFPVSVTAEPTAADGTVQTISGTVQGQHVVELRLCIAPIGKAREATPALRVHLATTLSPLMAAGTPSPAASNPQMGETTSSGDFILTFPSEGWCPLFPGKSHIVGRDNSSGQDVNCEIHVERNAIPARFEAYFSNAEVGTPAPSFSVPGVRFLPITGTICEDWLEFQVSESRYRTMQGRIAERALGYAIAEGGISEPRFSDFMADSLVDEVDRRLCDAAYGLDLGLEAQAVNLRRAFDTARQLAEQQHQDGWQQVKERLASYSPPQGES